MGKYKRNKIDKKMKNKKTSENKLKIYIDLQFKIYIQALNIFITLSLKRLFIINIFLQQKWQRKGDKKKN